MKKLITIAFILLLSCNGWAEEKQHVIIAATTDSLQIVKSELTQIKTELLQISSELQLVKKNIGNEQTEIKEFVNDKYGKIFNFWAIIGAILGFFLTIIVISYLVNLYIKSQVRKYFNSNTWFEALKTKINKQLDQNKLKAKMKIVVLSSGDENDMSLFLKANDFVNVNYHTLTGNLAEDKKIISINPHILIINNQSNQFKLKNITLGSGLSVPDNNTPINDLVNLIKNEYQTLAVFYFNDTGDNLPRELNTGLKSSFANSYASFYHNLLDLMRYKYLVIDKKEF